MGWRTSARVALLCGLLGACGAKHGVSDAGLEGVELDGGDDLDGGDEEIAIGDPVDLNGDGKLDGNAIDTNGDGLPDAVDTNGDGKADAPLPDNLTPVPNATGSTSADGGVAQDGSVLIQSDGSSPFATNDAGQVLCGTGPCACSNGIDDDHDGLSDLADPECVSSWDNDESSFATGIPGDNRDDACQDCFFDGNSGSGNDGCYLPSSCLSKGNASSGHGRCSSCEQTDQCKKFCEAYTPNGCDCFGCCTVRLANGTSVSVALGTGCNIDGNTVTGCNTCVPNDSCGNTCGKCELCPGKTLADLPPECFQTQPPADGGTGTGSDAGTGTGTGSDAGTGTGSDGGTIVDPSNDSGTGNPPPPPPPPPPVYTCDPGVTVCGAGLPACPNGYSCDFGCCTLIPIILL